MAHFSADPGRGFKWTDLTAEGVTDMGKALTLVAEQLAMPPMTERALPPVLVLISDGQPTDDFAGGLKTLTDLPWGKKAVPDCHRDQRRRGPRSASKIHRPPRDRATTSEQFRIAGEPHQVGLDGRAQVGLIASQPMARATSPAVQVRPIRPRPIPGQASAADVW